MKNLPFVSMKGVEGEKEKNSFKEGRIKRKRRNRTHLRYSEHYDGNKACSDCECFKENDVQGTIIS